MNDDAVPQTPPGPDGAPLGSGTDSLVDLLALGGPVVWILIALSVVALTVALFKSVELLLARRGGRRVARALDLWRRGRHGEALDEVTDASGGIPALLGIAMRGRAGGAPEALVREEIQRVAANDMTRLRGNLRTLEVIGQIGPLLGLFGTVLGMIEAFRRMEEAGSRVDPSVLSGGIWQALLTTGVGLAVAIPTVLVHQWLERRADAHAHRIEDAVTQVFTSDLHRAAGRGTVGRDAPDDAPTGSGRLRGDPRAA